MANLMKLKRIEKDLTQNQLSRLSGVEQHRISLMERGFIKPIPQEAEALAKILEIEPSDLQASAKAIKKELENIEF